MAVSDNFSVPRDLNLSETDNKYFSLPKVLVGWPNFLQNFIITYWSVLSILIVRIEYIQQNKDIIFPSFWYSVAIHAVFPRIRGFQWFSCQNLGPSWFSQNRWENIEGGGYMSTKSLGQVVLVSCLRINSVSYRKENFNGHVNCAD